MQSSPVTPIGTGCRNRSRMYKRVLAMGRPMGIGPWVRVSGVTVYTQHPTTVSVGPYSLTSKVRGACWRQNATASARSEEHTSELQSPVHLVCRLLLEKKKKTVHTTGTSAKH